MNNFSIQYWIYRICLVVCERFHELFENNWLSWFDCKVKFSRDSIKLPFGIYQYKKKTFLHVKSIAQMLTNLLKSSASNMNQSYPKSICQNWKLPSGNYRRNCKHQQKINFISSNRWKPTFYRSQMWHSTRMEAGLLFYNSFHSKIQNLD